MRSGRRLPGLRIVPLALAVVALAWSFWRSDGWLQLCAGLAIFLFGMQCLEEGLRQLAGGKLEQLLARSTGTPVRGLLFGVAGTTLLQSSTLVSLLAIAFISSGLIQLAGGIAIILGANLGATSGIWLLAVAGQNVSLSPLALPLLVFGVLGGFFGQRGKAAGRVVLGVAFIFLGIDGIRGGFEALGGGLDLAGAAGRGLGSTLLFVLVGLVATVVLQSTHAVLMLALAALAGGQLQLEQGLAIAIGSNVGSSVSTAFVGMLGGNRSGQRLALAHVLFNVVTALLALLLLLPLTWTMAVLARLAGFGNNALLQLALFHTLFNVTGVALFWPLQDRLARWLVRWLPDREEPAMAVADVVARPAPQVRACHLSEQALGSVDAATAAVALELRHLRRLSLEVIRQALCLPLDAPARPGSGGAPPAGAADIQCMDAEALYQQRVKGVYGDLLSFMGRLELPLDEEHQRFWTHAQMAALQMVNAVKDAKHLQKNLGLRLQEAESPLRSAYVDLRRHLSGLLGDLDRLGDLPPDADRLARLEELDRRAVAFEADFRQRLFAMVRRGELDGWQTGSLMNDLRYADRIHRSLHDAMAPADEPASLRELRRLAGEPVPAPAAG